MLKKMFLNGASPILFAATAISSTGNEKKEESTGTPVEIGKQYKCRPSELPLYEPLHARHDKGPPPKEEPSEVHKFIEQNVRFLRTQIQSGLSMLTEQSKQIEDFIEVGKAHSKATIDLLRDPSNQYQRYGAIAAGGFSGLIIASIRGGFFKKLFYTAGGAGAVASICYPDEAKQYAQEALVEAKKALSIAYNFVLGAKPGDEVSYNNPLSKFPTNLDELTDLGSDLYNSAKDTIFPSKK